jgi:uncharacterized protein YozE (UPF0346 family)
MGITFWRWLMSHKREQNALGDLARDAWSDRHNVPHNPDEFVAYIVDYPACEDAIETAREAVRSYNAWKAKVT